jgi:ABC-type branched-subunit amino acid transport system permease subunit
MALLLSIDNRYIIMYKMLFLVAILALTLAAPANDKLSQVPVLNFLRRDTLVITTLASTLAISMLKTPAEHFTTCLLNQQMGLEIKIQLSCGSTEGLDALHF